MKTIHYTLLLLFCSGTIAFAQFEGKRFISGNASTDFDNQDPATGKSTNNYSYNLSIGLGKFKTATKTGEWLIFSNLRGQKQNFAIPNDTITRKGINVFGIGTGYTWNFYKHLGEKFGIFGGPGVQLKYALGKQIQTNGLQLYEQKSSEISASLQLNAGAYYALNERWWLTASLAFSNPVYFAYTFNKTESVTAPIEPGYKSSGYQYRLAPSFNFPSVGLGLRYFFKD